MIPHNNDPAALASPGLPQATSEACINGTPQEDHGQQGNTEELVYERVPPKRTLTVSVCYRIRGRGQPLHFPVDAGDGE
jgi:hypothetical protein